MEEEIKALLAEDNWPRVYADIRRDSANNDFTTIEASRPHNRALNRYRDVYPYDHSRVVLKDHEPTDYINASLVKAPRANRRYILAQGPLPTTVGHFWRTVWQERSRAVLMLNRVMEKGQVKCHQYWPQEAGDTMSFDDVGLRLEHVSSEPGDHYTVRTLRLSHDESGESRDILHFHYTTWPDFGVPKCPDTFLLFLKAVRESGSLDDDVGPPVVHCSAGIGRSGTFCLVDTCLVLISKEGSMNGTIKDVLLELRNHRMGLIQTPDQLKFSYLAIAEGATHEGHLPPEILAEIPKARDQIPSDNSSDDEGAPPPLPPPRSESLKMQQLLQEVLANNHLEDPSAAAFPARLQESPSAHVNGNGGDQSSSSGGEPSPDSNAQQQAATKRPASAMASNSSSEGSTSGSSSSSSNARKTDSPTKCILNNQKMEERKREMELRRRKKEEANAALESKVQEMKRKATEAETWQRTKNRIYDTVIPFAVGFAMCVAGSYYFLKN